MTSVLHTLNVSMALVKTHPGLVTVLVICFTVTLLGVLLGGRENCVISVSHTLDVSMVLVKTHPGLVTVISTGEEFFVTKVMYFL